MKRTLIALGSLLMLLIVLSCNGASTPTPQPTAAYHNLIVGITGSAQLKRAGWTASTAVGFGALIQPDDTLEVSGQVTVLCGNLQLKMLESGTHKAVCPPGQKALVYQASQHRGIIATVPYIQYPRNTLVLEDRPLLRWNSTGASDYTVAIVQSGEEIWSEGAVVGNEFQYPTDAPALTPETDYLLAVWDNDTGTESSEDPAKGIGFQVATDAQRAALKAHCDPVAALTGIDVAARDFTLAVCYATWTPTEGGRGAWGEAWRLLESVAETQDAPAVYLWRGDVLMQMRAPEDDTQAAYQAALQRAEALGDVESQAAAYVGLWRVMGTAAYRAAAIQSYEKLGDKPAVKALE
ncbi:MAG: hypothetical protein JXA33_27100 [Anaerolineae bacterium]|nr:hypothetical protein [Anaerolineae bacterium]